MGKGGGSNIPSVTTFHLNPELKTYGSHLPEGTAQSLGLEGVHIDGESIKSVDVDPYHKGTIPEGSFHKGSIPVYPKKSPEIFNPENPVLNPSTQYVSEIPSLENLFNPANNEHIKQLSTKLDSLQEELKTKEKQLEELTNSYKNLVKEQKKEADNLENQIKSLKKTQDEQLSNKTQANEQLINEQKQKIDLMEKESKKQKADLENFKKNINSLESEIEIEKKNKFDLLNKIDELSGPIGVVRSNIRKNEFRFKVALVFVGVLASIGIILESIFISNMNNKSKPEEENDNTPKGLNKSKILKKKKINPYLNLLINWWWLILFLIVFIIIIINQSRN